MIIPDHSYQIDRIVNPQTPDVETSNDEASETEDTQVELGEDE